jgi:hypothetical protein
MENKKEKEAAMAKDYFLLPVMSVADVDDVIRLGKKIGYTFVQHVDYCKISLLIFCKK